MKRIQDIFKVSTAKSDEKVGKTITNSKIELEYFQVSAAKSAEIFSDIINA